MDLNPLLINTLNNVTSLVDDVVGEVDGLLGSITQGGTTLNYLVDNLGNIVQQVGSGTSSIVGNYLQNMTLVSGSTQSLSGGNTQKTYSYSPLNSLVNIVFNTAGQVSSISIGSESGLYDDADYVFTYRSCKRLSRRRRVEAAALAVRQTRLRARLVVLGSLCAIHNTSFLPYLTHRM